MEKHTSAGCYILRLLANNTFELLIMFRQWKDGRSAYVIPKGHIEEGETMEQAALREVYEETGYKNVQILTYVGSRTYIPEKMPDIEKTDHYYLAFLENDEKDKGEKKFTLEWKELDAAFNTLAWENSPEILKKIKSYITLHL